MAATKKTAAVKPRKRKVSKYNSFKLSKKIPHPAGPLSSAWKLLSRTRSLIWATRKQLGSILVVYLILNFILVRGFTSPIDIYAVKDAIRQSLGSQISKFTSTGALFGSLLASPLTSGTSSASIYQVILLLFMSLVLIWLFRQHSAGLEPTAKEAFYRAPTPLVPFMLVILTMGVQLIPIFISSSLYSIIISGGIAVTGYEKGVWILFFGMLSLLSAYMISSSFFALYIVTLPGTAPLQALRSARQLVMSRRFSILCKLLFLIVIALVALIIVVVPAIYFAASIAPWIYFVFTVTAVVFVNAYLFSLYKELL